MPKIGGAGSHGAAVGDTINIRETINVLWRGKWLIVALGAVFMLLAVLMLSRAELTYRATASVMFGIDEVNVLDIEALLSYSDFESDEMENEIQVLYSSNLLTRVIDDLALQGDPYFNPVLAEAQAAEEEPGPLDALTGAVSSLLGGVKALLSPPPRDTVPGLDSGAEASRERAGTLETLRDGLSVTPVLESTVIEISFVSYSPQLSADVVNAIVNQYITDQLQVRLESANAATEWLARRVEEFRAKVQASEEAVASLRATLSSDAGQSLEITQQQLALLNTSLSTARGDVASLDARYSRLAEARRSGRSLGSESQLIREYREEESELLARRNALSGDHPAIPGLEAQLSELRDRIDEETGRILATAEIELETARSQVQELERALRELEDKSMAQSRAEVRVSLMEREVQANRLLYENLLTRMNETAEQEELQRANARILSPADVPLEPQSRNIAKFGLMAGIFGGLLGSGILLLRNNLSNNFRSPRHLEDVTGQTVLAMLPELAGASGSRGLIEYFIRKPNSSLAEAMRGLRASLLSRKRSLHPPKVVMFTSSMPDEGKSTTSMLFAVASRQMGRSTILVDCDLRLPSAEEFFDLPPNRASLLSVLDGKAEVSDAIHEDPVSGLHVLMARRGEHLLGVDRNAADVLSSKRFAELIRGLSRLYDLVVLDTPPVLIVSDACVVSNLADAVVYAVRWNGTPRDAVTEGLGELEQVRAPVSGTVLTLVDENKAARSILDGYRHHRSRDRSYYVD